nr:phage tail protein [Caballeronia pedi]
MVDRYGLYAIAKYCDELVPNGDGGKEPRFACNCHITSRSHAFALLQQLASVFRGIVFWSAGSVLSSADMPSDPVYVYNPANVVNGTFTYRGSSLKSRYTAASVTWCNPHNGYKQAVETVEDAEGIVLYGYNAAEITAFGCASRSQAQRAGQWLLQTSRLETETVTFSVGLDGALTLPGQVIEIADPLRSLSCAGGRIKEIDAAGRVVLDRSVHAQHGDRLMVILPDARACSVEIAEASGAVVTLSAPFKEAPVRGAAWALQSTASATQRFRVVSVSEIDEGHAFSITATRHEPEKYAAVDNAATSNIFDGKYVPVDSPSNLAVRAVMGPEGKLAAEVSWKFALGVKQYNVRLIGPNGVSRSATAGGLQSNQIFDNVVPGSYTARVGAQGWGGSLSVVAKAIAALKGLVYVTKISSDRTIPGSVLFHLNLEQIARELDFVVELRIGKEQSFDHADQTFTGPARSPMLSVPAQHGGYVWARVRYGRQSDDRGSFSLSAWYPSETEPGIGF